MVISALRHTIHLAQHIKLREARTKVNHYDFGNLALGPSICLPKSGSLPPRKICAVLVHEFAHSSEHFH